MKIKKFSQLNEKLTLEQQQVIDDFISKFGGVDVKTYNNKTQLLLDKNMILMEGLSYEWLEILKKQFDELIIGIPENDNKYGIYITLFNI